MVRRIIRSLGGYLVAIGLVALATWLKYLAMPDIIPADVPILYVVTIAVTAVFFGLGPSIFVCVLSVLAFDYFFIPPLYTLGPRDITSVPVLTIFLVVGILFSYLASNIRKRNKSLAEEVAARKQTEEELRALSARMLVAQENERHEIATELHDEIGQQLTLLKATVARAMKQPPDQAASAMVELNEQLGQMVKAVRDISLNLRAAVVEYQGLVPALEWLAERVNASGTIKVSVSAPDLEGSLPTAIATSVYRIVQEALTNAVRYSKGSEATIRLTCENGMLTVDVWDDGQGFDLAALVPASSNGLSVMRERAKLAGGRLAIVSSPGVGTRITAEMPLACDGARKGEHQVLLRP